MSRQLPLVGALAIAVSFVSACSEPPAPRTDEDEQAATEAAQPADVDEVALREALADVRDAAAGARAALQEAAASDEEGAALDASARALALLLDDGGTSANDEPVALFPANTSTRDSSEEQDDALTSAVSVARDAGGDLGRTSVELLRDPLAGDLGAWERDASGVVSDARAAAQGTEIDTITQQVLALSGEGTRALAWAFAADDASDPQLRAAAAERGATHLDIVLDAVDRALEGGDADQDA